MKAVNLLPSDNRGSARSPGASPAKAAPSGGGFGAYAVLGVLAFAVVAVLAYVLVTNTVKDRKADLARVTAETEHARSQAAALRPYGDFQLLAQQRVATVSQLARTRFDWERSLRDLSRALPRDVHLKSLKGTVASGAGGAAGGAGSGLRSAIQAPAIELTGCTRSQSNVARLMSRLRAVRGVTRVTLSKSDKDNTSTATTTGGMGTGKQITLCDKGQPPAFELVMFFERAVVAPGAGVAVAPGGSSLPGVGAAKSAAPGQPTAPNGTTPSQPAAPGGQPATSGASAPSSGTQGVAAP